MKVVDAVWEKRNLGLDSVEMEVELNDTYEEVNQILSEVKGQYLAVKVPTNRTDIIWLMAKHNYIFVEDMMFFEHDLHEIVRTPLQQRLYDAVEIYPMEEVDYAILFEEIDNGSFSFDRISNDPFFTKEQSIRRFHNWLNDERERGAEFLKVTMRGEIIGFFTIWEIEPGVYTSALGGTFMKWRKGGLGTIVQASEEVKKRGGKKLILGASTNNMTQIRSLIQNGFFPVRTNHVYVKHCE